MSERMKPIGTAWWSRKRRLPKPLMISTLNSLNCKPKKVELEMKLPAE
jgi:hypothetical protein